MSRADFSKHIAEFVQQYNEGKLVETSTGLSELIEHCYQPTGLTHWFKDAGFDGDTLTMGQYCAALEVEVIYLSSDTANKPSKRALPELPESVSSVFAVAGSQGFSLAALADGEVSRDAQILIAYAVNLKNALAACKKAELERVHEHRSTVVTV